MKTVEIANKECPDSIKTVCFPDGDSIQGQVAAVYQDKTSHDREIYWWVHIGGLEEELKNIDQTEWDDYVTWVNQIDALVKEKFNAKVE